jgi:hypothetical protein
MMLDYSDKYRMFRVVDGFDMANLTREGWHLLQVLSTEGKWFLVGLPHALLAERKYAKEMRAADFGVEKSEPLDGKRRVGEILKLATIKKKTRAK